MHRKDSLILDVINFRFIPDGGIVYKRRYVNIHLGPDNIERCHVKTSVRKQKFVGVPLFLY